MGRERRFAVERVMHNAAIVNAHKIECGKCSSRLYVPLTGRNGFEFTAPKFVKKGWTVGKSARTDRCPKCGPKTKTKAPKKEQYLKHDQVSIEPRELSRDDRRIVYAAVDEHYLGEGEGYEPPYTDQKVAAELKVPVAWVKTVREEFFGNEGSNELYEDFLAKAAPVIAEMKNMANSLRVQLETCKKFNDRIAELERLAKKIG